MTTKHTLTANLKVWAVFDVTGEHTREDGVVVPERRELLALYLDVDRALDDGEKWVRDKQRDADSATALQYMMIPHDTVDQFIFAITCTVDDVLCGVEVQSWLVYSNELTAITRDENDS